MADGVYHAVYRQILLARFHWLSSDVRAVLIDTAVYAPDFALHRTLRDVPDAALASRAAPLDGKRLERHPDGTLHAFASRRMFDGLRRDNTARAVLLYVHGETDDASPLVACSARPAALPVRDSGGVVTIAWGDDPACVFEF